MSEHGTESRYVHGSCRCDACKRAAREARQDRRRAKPEATHAYNVAYKRAWRARQRVRLDQLEAVAAAARQYLDTGRGDLDGALAALPSPAEETHTDG